MKNCISVQTQENNVVLKLVLHQSSQGLGEAAVRQLMKEVDKEVLDGNKNDEDGAEREADGGDGLDFVGQFFELEIVEDAELMGLVVVGEGKKDEKEGG